MPLHISTPLVHSTKLSQFTPCNVYVKQEHAQPSGSFKHRGTPHYIQKTYENILKDPEQKDPEQKHKKVIVAGCSGGNAGNAAAQAATSLGLESIIVVNVLVNENMKQKIKESGAKVIVYGNNFNEANDHLKEVIIPSLGDDVAVIYCHPSDHPFIWEGHSTIVDELVEQLESQGQLHNLKAIVCSVGGGGLYSGLVEGLDRHHLDIPLLTIECETCPAFQAAIDNGKPVTLSGYKTIATTLGAPSVCAQSVICYNSHKTKHLLIKDSQAANACLQYAKDYNVIVEPACGAALAAAYDDLLTPNSDFFGGFHEDDIVVIVACGGVSTTTEDLANYTQEYNL